MNSTHGQRGRVIIRIQTRFSITGKISLGVVGHPAAHGTGLIRMELTGVMESTTLGKVATTTTKEE